ncbi:hypothetical protein EG028_22305 [Chitinophaga barathri]|uniref:Uncharacterized protein n=1 Tax=Chitinophaga barathri TaxID=1647451 RepID=A0A3N4M6A9_9BACT|nr:hypothetical protein EG028_22305 [Chitinophaga barathri]
MNMKKIIKCNALVVRIIVFQAPEYLPGWNVRRAFYAAGKRENEDFVQAFPFYGEVSLGGRQRVFCY